MDALHRLEALGVPVLNPPRAVEAAVDKYLALARLEADGLAGARRPGSASRPTRRWRPSSGSGGDVVVKPLFGSEGRGLVRVSDPEMARRTFRTLERLGARPLRPAVRPQSRLRRPRVRPRRSGPRRDPATRAARANGGRTWRSAASPEACVLDPRSSRWRSASARAVGAIDGGGRPAARPRRPAAGRPRGQRRARLEGPGGGDGGRRRRRRSWPISGTSPMTRRPEPRPARPGRLPPRGDGAEAGERPPVRRLRRCPLPRLPPRAPPRSPGRSTAPGRSASGRRSSRPSRRPGGSSRRTRTSG